MGLRTSAATKIRRPRLPADIRRLFGFALSLAQSGDKHDAAKVLEGLWWCRGKGCGNGNPDLLMALKCIVVPAMCLRDLGLADAEKLKIKLAW